MDIEGLIKVSYSESDAARQCFLKHQLLYKERWKPDETAPALARGTQMHNVLEYHYTRLNGARSADPTANAELLAEIRKELVEREMLDHESIDELVTPAYDDYVAFYGVDAAWDILAVELPFEIPLYDRSGAPSEFYLVGRIDLVVRNRATGKIFVVDHKFAGQLPTDKALDFDEQLALYTVAARRLGFDVFGAMYDVLRSKRLKRAMTPDEKFSRAVVTKTNYELGVAEHELVDYMRLVHTPRDYDPPRTPDSERCNWKCSVREACLAGRKSGPDRMRSFLEDTGFTCGKPENRPVAAPAQLELSAPPPATFDRLPLLDVYSGRANTVDWWWRH